MVEPQNFDNRFKSSGANHSQDSSSSKTPAGLHIVKGRSQEYSNKEVTGDDFTAVKAVKRKLIDSESFPATKKQNVTRVLQKQTNSSVIISSFGNEARYLAGDFERKFDESIIEEKRLEEEIGVIDLEVSSVKKIDNVLLDFRCSICQELPRLANRSELYRHYAFRHFSSDLLKEFGHLKTCPVCNIKLKGSSYSVTHFGQKHSYVEHYLPEGAWIPFSKKGVKISSGRTRGLICLSEKSEVPRRKRKLVKVKSQEKVGTGESFAFCPEIPHEFDIEGNVRSLSSSKHFLTVARVDGFDIELENEGVRCFDNQTSEETPGVVWPNISAHEQVKCRICKQKFDTKKCVVVHAQTAHGLRGSGDETKQYEALLSTGYIVHETGGNVAPDTSNAASCGGNPWRFDETEELTEEELEIVAAVETYQNRRINDKSTKIDIADDDDCDKSEEEWEEVCAEFEAKLKASGLHPTPVKGDAAVVRSDQEWEVACDAFKYSMAEVVTGDSWN